MRSRELPSRPERRFNTDPGSVSRIAVAQHCNLLTMRANATGGVLRIIDSTRSQSPELSFAGRSNQGGESMKNHLAIFTIPLFASIGIPAGPALADDDSAIALDRVVIDRHVDTFAVLPDGVRNPEGLTANPANGDIYVATFDITASPNN